MCLRFAHASPLLRRLGEIRDACECLAWQVLTHHMQRFAVWFGGSVLSTLPDFYTTAHTKAEYEEVGPNICRTNAVFRGI